MRSVGHRNTRRNPKEMLVQSGRVHRENRRVLKNHEVEEHRLKVKMVRAKHRHDFYKLIREEQIKQKENWLLEKKRKRIDAAAKDGKKKRIIDERKKAHCYIFRIFYLFRLYFTFI